MADAEIPLELRFAAGYYASNDGGGKTGGQLLRHSIGPKVPAMQHCSTYTLCSCATFQAACLSICNFMPRWLAVDWLLLVLLMHVLHSSPEDLSSVERSGSARW